MLSLIASDPGRLCGEEPLNGAELYKNTCARCHGEQGQGTPKHGDKLTGELSLGQLTTVVQETMPEDKPGSLSEAQAMAISQYVHEAFYSTVARERNRAARVELSRLTVRQYRQTVADLVGSFRSASTWGTERGLRASYYKSRNRNRENLVLERIDPQIAFDFQDQAPVPDKMEPHEFSIIWRGSLLAPETGEFEFIARTEHAVVVYLNDDRVPLIDAGIKSGSETEYRGSIFLLAGRPYQLRVEYSKGKTGVSDPKLNKKPKEVGKSSMTLLWKRPNRVAEVVPTTALSTQGVPEQFAARTPFPPDDRSYGWERGTAISKEWDDATTDAAIETTAYIIQKLPELSGVKDDTADRSKKLQNFCRKFAERAFRTPLAETEYQALIEKQFTEQSNPDEAVKRVLLLTLKSPRFLYRELGQPTQPYRRAMRLSFALWDSQPDETLRSAAAKDQLKTEAQLRTQAERLLKDSRSQAKLREFLLTWLKADHNLDVAKDATRFPGFDQQLIADLRTSLELGLDRVLQSPESDFRQLLAQNELMLNGRLAKFYGLELPLDAPFQPMQFEPEHRAGVLTHPYLMASFAHNTETSPIHRGVFLARGMLGISLKPPPEAIAPVAPDLHPDLTTRERVAMQTKAAVCMTCHGIINPLGFTLENFDAVGRFRELDQTKPIDTQGSYRTNRGELVKLDNARELAAFMVRSEEAHEAFVEQLFHHLIQQPVAAFGPDTLEKLRVDFAEQKFSIRQLALRIALVAAMHEPSSEQVSNKK